MATKFTFRPQLFAIAGEILALVWFGWQLALVLFLMELRMVWS